MSDEHRLDPTQVNRRDFLARLAVAGGATAIVPHVPLQFNQSLRAAASARELKPDYVLGMLLELGPDFVRLHAPGYIPEVFRVEVPAGTQICRRGCGIDLSALRLGDRIEAGTHLASGGLRIAEWVQANAVVGWGTVRDLSDGRVVLGPMDNMSKIGRELIIESYTKVFTGTEPDLGSTRALNLHDNVYYTGSGLDTSKLSPTIWAYTVFRTSRESY